MDKLTVGLLIATGFFAVLALALALGAGAALEEDEETATELDYRH